MESVSDCYYALKINYLNALRRKGNYFENKSETWLSRSINIPHKHVT